MPSVAFVDGKVLPEAEATIPITDRGFLYGDGVFTSLRVEGGRAVWWTQHLRRLERDAIAIGIEPPPGGRLDEALHALTLAVAADRAVVRISLTRLVDGVSGPHAPPRSPARLTAVARPLATAPTTLAVRTEKVRREPRVYRHKVVNYLDNILALRRAAIAGVDEVLFVDERDGVLEHATGNVFLALASGEWVTPPLDLPILDGIARRTLITVLQEAGHPVAERLVDRDELAGAFELVHCNAVRGPRAVTLLDGKKLAPSALFRALDAAFLEALRSD